MGHRIEPETAVQPRRPAVSVGIRRISGVTVSDLELDLDVFQGPFDLLLALVMREEIELSEVPIAEIVVAFVDRMQERGEIDLDSASEFLVLIAALLEIKVRLLFPGEEDDELEELTAEQAEAELIERLLEYRRYAASARWLGERTADLRVFRTGPAPLAPRPDPEVEAFSEDPWQLHAVIGRLLTPPPKIDISSVRRRLVPVSEFLSRFRALLRERRGFAFEEAVAGLDPISQAAAFLAILELYKAGEADPVQDELFGPIRVARGSGKAAPQPAPAETEPSQIDRAIA
jgi:segregation and condensation protein A